MRNKVLKVMHTSSDVKCLRGDFFVFYFHQGEEWIFFHIKNIIFVTENQLQARVA